MREKPLTEFMSSKKVAKEHKEKPAEPKVAGLKGPWELPEGWRWVRLEDVAGIRGNSGVKKKLLQFNSIAFIPMELIPEKGVFSRYELRESTNIKSYSYAEPEDILLAKITPSFENGKQGIVPKNVPNNFALATTEVYPIYIKENNLLDRMYLFYILKSKYARKTLEDQMLGTTGRQRVPKEAVLKLKIPLPPLSEQKRIVAKLDEVSKRIDEAKRLAREAREEAERLMASALHEVFSKAEEMGWEWSTIGKVAKDMKPGFARNKKHISEDGIPHLRPNNIDIGHLNLEKLVKVKLDEKIDIEEYYLQKGDVLFNNTNSFELVGRAALITEDLPWGYSNHITRIRVKQDVILPEWLTVTINYLWMQGYFKRVCTRWVGQAGVNMNTLKKTPVPLPPLDEQKRIVAYLDSISERAQKLVKLYEERERELERLFPAILDRAFRGEV
ncbi:MAG TPA: hypothetical protein ENL40_07735, partial [Thermococcus litoralis]|nr:hypothetical protein [Thermococcus litoralis]